MTRHIHADHIIAAANDTSIEWECKDATDTDSDAWLPTARNFPKWSVECVYRQKPKPHVHQALIDIANADPSIKWQVKSFDEWSDMDDHPTWVTSLEYRQKPKLVKKWQWIWTEIEVEE